ncbi:MAG: DMT family transporter [Pseudomonadota bacterium]
MAGATNPESRRDVTHGVLWMVGCLASFIGMAVASRELAASLSIFQILFFRALVGLAILAFFARAIWPELKRCERLGLHTVRNSVHFVAQFCWTLGVALLPLAEVFALEFTMPIWVALFAYLFLGERLDTARLLACVGSFLGVLVILRPGVALLDPASFIVLAAAMGYGLSIVMVKSLTQTCSPGIVVAWMILLQLPMGLAFALTDWRPSSLGDVPWILVAGLTGLSAHYTMAQALRRLDASVAIPVDFLRVPLIALVGFYFYQESIEVWVFVGALMIFGSNYYAILRSSRAAQNPAPQVKGTPTRSR